MNAEQYLNQIKTLDVKINQKLKEIADLRAQMCSVKGVDYSKTVKSTSHSLNAPFTELTDKIVDLEAEVTKEIDDFAREKYKIINEIQCLDDRNYIDVLFKKYVEFKPLDMISVEMGYSLRSVYYFHKDALKEFQKKVCTKLQ